MSWRPVTFTEVYLKPCFACGSDLGPFMSDPDGRAQVICSTCGARGPYQTYAETAEERWNVITRPSEQARNADD